MEIRLSNEISPYTHGIAHSHMAEAAESDN